MILYTDCSRICVCWLSVDIHFRLRTSPCGKVVPVPCSRQALEWTVFVRSVRSWSFWSLLLVMVRIRPLGVEANKDLASKETMISSIWRQNVAGPESKLFLTEKQRFLWRGNRMEARCLDKRTWVYLCCWWWAWVVFQVYEFSGDHNSSTDEGSGIVQPKFKLGKRNIKKIVSVKPLYKQ